MIFSLKKHFENCKCSISYSCGSLVFLYDGCNDITLYNTQSKQFRKFTDVLFDGEYMFGKGKNSIHIINAVSGEDLYENEYIHSEELLLKFAGKNKNGPVFFDRKYSSCIYPQGDKYKMHNDIIIKPIVIDGKNIASITLGDNGLGVVDSFGSRLFENKYDTIDVKLVISSKNAGGNTQKIIPFQMNFEKGSL